MITISSSYLGCLIAKRMLLDYGLSVTDVLSPTTILVTDDCHCPQAARTRPNTVIVTMTDKPARQILQQSGHLQFFGQESQFAPKYLVELVAANSIVIAVLGMLLTPSPAIHLSLVDLVQYFGTFTITAQQHGMYARARGHNLLDGGTPFYRIYACREGYVAVGALQHKFYRLFVGGLGLDRQRTQMLLENQYNEGAYGEMVSIVSEKMREKTAEEWQQHYGDTDACVTAVKRKIKKVGVQPIMQYSKL